MVVIKDKLKELENAKSNTKQCAIIWELGNMGTKAEKASGKLSEILKKDSDWRRRSFAAWSLGRIGGKKAQKTLEKIAKRKEEDEIVQHGAKWALYWLKVKLACVPTEGPCTLEELKALVSDKSEMIPEF